VFEQAMMGQPQVAEQGVVVVKIVLAQCAGAAAMRRNVELRLQLETKVLDCSMGQKHSGACEYGGTTFARIAEKMVNM
jgi:hypothetical protein